MNPNRPIPRHTVIKITKVKDKEIIPKAAREKTNSHLQVITSLRLSVDFSAKTL